eukprot:CAMPEP_0206470366 /NCGR_PEP_ID=MMETSP0324_2-20121206/30886_1 /ASSEMBLY_ACC=CAM_ASM_000836 /TAXON_ID=2866 /ORGANISM="Crypthecodinium cohnii, Strain Seligo" /LENGTH=413 /DNA_ID=CAMNT_0053944409 /DNA_START=108 /DNA_END=1349 /DNA_ORIENTATION=+
MTAQSKPEMSAEIKRKEEIENALVWSYGLFMFSVMLVIPTRAPMILHIKGGDAAAAAKVMGAMASASAVLELFMNPVFGRLSDKFGRKPFLLLSPLIDSFLHALVGLMPYNLPVQFIDKVISGSLIFAFVAPVNAVLVDLWGAGEQLVPRMARAQMFAGLGATAGPYIGAKLGQKKSFQFSAAMFVATFAWIWKTFPETLKPENRKEFDITACSPLRFLNLFKDKTTAALATTIGLQSFGDTFNVNDINFLYLKSVLGYGQSQVGTFSTAMGFSQIVNARLMKQMSQALGGAKATLLSNISWALGMLAFGTSKSSPQLGAALALLSGGHLRATAVSSYLLKAGAGAGLGAAETDAARANLTALIKVFVPMLYSSVYAKMTSNGRNIPGAPHILIAFFTMLSQLLFSTINVKAL